MLLLVLKRGFSKWTPITIVDSYLLSRLQESRAAVEGRGRSFLFAQDLTVEPEFVQLSVVSSSSFSL